MATKKVAKKAAKKPSKIKDIKPKKSKASKVKGGLITVRKAGEKPLE